MDNNNGSQQSKAQCLIKSIFQSCLSQFQPSLEEAALIQSNDFYSFIQQLFARSKDGIITLIKENDQHKEQIIKLRRDIERLKQDYVEQSEQTEQLRQAIIELQKRNGQLEKEVVETKGELGEAKRWEEQSKREKDALEQEMESMGIKIKQIEQQKLLIERECIRESDKRYALQRQLELTQQALKLLQRQFESLQGNRQQLSRSLERNKEQLQHLRDIVEESEYLSSLSPLSKQKHDQPFSQQQQKSINSQNQRQTIQEDIVVRLSQTHLPLYPQQQALELPPKSLRPQTASQHKPLRKMPKSVQSHQKPKKQQTKQQGLLSKPQNKQVVRSQINSIFKDRMKYRYQHDQSHQQQVEKLKERVKAKQEEKNKLMAEVAMLKALRTEPVLLPGPSREGLAKIRSQNQELRRIARELTMRKGAAEQRYEQERERCEYYKTQHRKIYEKLLLRQAESALLQQQLSLVQQEDSSRVDQSEIFDNLSQRFNSLVRHHEVQQPSFRSGAQNDLRCYYSIQNSMQMEQAGDSLTVQNHKQVPIKLCESLDSPAKALPSEESKNMEQLFLQDIEEIAYLPQQQAEVQTQRLLLSELMQNSRKQNSFTECQFLPCDQLRNPLEIASLGVLAEYIPIKVSFNMFQCENVVVSPHQKTLSIHQLNSQIVLPTRREKSLQLVAIETVSILKKKTQLSRIELQAVTIYPFKMVRSFQFTSLYNFTIIPSIKIDSYSQYIPNSNQHSSQTENATRQTSSNTALIITYDKQVQINQQFQHFSVNTEALPSKQAECNTQPYNTQQMRMSSKQGCLSHTQINTQASINISTLMNTDSLLMIENESQTYSLILVDTASEMFYSPATDAESNTDCKITSEKGLQSNNSQRLLIHNFVLEAIIQPLPKHLNTVKLTDITIQNKVRTQARSIMSTLDVKITHIPKIMNEFSINTDRIEVVCKQSNTDSLSMMAESTQYECQSSFFRIRRSMEIILAPLILQELQQLEKIQLKEIEEQPISALGNDKSSFNIPSSNPSDSALSKDQSYYIPINSENTLLLSPRIGKFEDKSLNQINSSRTRDSSSQLRRKAKKSPNKIKKAKLQKRKLNEGSFCIQGQIDISLQSINSESPSSQQSFTKNRKNSKPVENEQKTAAQTPYLQKGGISPEDCFDSSKWKTIRQYFYMLKQITFVSSLKLGKGSKLFSFKNWTNELYIFSAQKEGQHSYFVLWKGRLLRMSTKAPQLLQLKEQKRFLSVTGHLLLGNSEVVIANDVLQVKRSRKQRIFRGQMAEGEWKLLHAWTYQLQ